MSTIQISQSARICCSAFECYKSIREDGKDVAVLQMMMAKQVHPVYMSGIYLHCCRIANSKLKEWVPCVCSETYRRAMNPC
jgi:hypothetical protein